MWQNAKTVLRMGLDTDRRFDPGGRLQKKSIAYIALSRRHATRSRAARFGSGPFHLIDRPAEPDGTVKIYWGAADTVMCVGEANVSDLVGLCLEHSRPAK